MANSPENEPWRNLLEKAFSAGSDCSWSIEEDPRNKAGVKEKYKINYGLVSFDLGINQERVLLEWDANLPDYMFPGSARVKYTEFLSWLMAKIPSRLFPTRMTDTESKSRYAGASSFELVYDDQRRTYKLYNEDEKLDFALSFIKPDQQIKKLIFNGSTNTSFTPTYALGIEYGSDLGPPRLSLSTRMEFNGEKAWNQDTVRWVLGTHRSEQFLGNDKTLIPQLSGVIQEKVSDSFKSYVASMPQFPFFG